jgi:cell wall-associated NlpC family hydrolase
LTSAEQFIRQSGLCIAEAARALGQEVFSKPYQWGGKTKDGFIKSNLFETVETPQPGDIIIFKAHQGAVNHIGIVISDRL